MSATAVQGLDSFHDIINSNQYTVFDFWASWCAPCRVISPVFDRLAAKYPGVKFYKVDTDDQFEISEELRIRALPNFILFKNGKQVGSAVGAVPAALENLVKKASQ